MDGAFEGLFDRMLATSTLIEFVAVRRDGRIESANAAFAHHVGLASGELRGRPLAELLTTSDAARVAQWLGKMPVPRGPVRLNFLAAGGAPYTHRCMLDGSGETLRILSEPEFPGGTDVADELMRVNNDLATMARERERRNRELERMRRELEAALEKLKTSYWHLQKIQEVMPLCMRCGNIKTDASTWQSVVEYLKSNDIFVSHGYCPGCEALVIQEFGLDPESK